MPKQGVTLQINLAPADLPTARYVLPHQLRQWAGQVQEILLVLDLHRSRGRYAAGWSQRLPGMRAMIDECCARYGKARTLDVDYSAAAVGAVAEQFFGGDPVPAKDRQGAPYYAYLFGLQRASYDVILHMDSDMMYGGGSQSWVDEAIALIDANPSVLACNPLPGPPTTDGTLRSQQLTPYPYLTPAFSSPSISTRHFIIDRRRLWERVGRLALSRPRVKDYLKAVVDGQTPCNPLEVNLSEAMSAHGLIRVDFLGSDPGMWGVHPVHRTPMFFQRLPSLIADIEGGRIPERQRGEHDLNDSMVDWTGADRTAFEKLTDHLRIAAGRLPWRRPNEVVG